MKMKELLEVMDPDAELYISVRGQNEFDEFGDLWYATYIAGAKSTDERFNENRPIMDCLVERIRIGLNTVPTVFIWVRKPLSE